MKKNLLLLSALAALGASAATVSEPTAAWANLLIGIPGQDQATDIAVHGNNEVYWMLTDGSTSANADVTYAGVELYKGAPYEGTSSNKNLTLLKTDAAGTKQWCLYSRWGDFSANEGGLAVKSNGDIVFAGGVRHTDGFFSEPVTIVDGKGTATTIDWTIGDRRWDQLIIGTVSADGDLLWVKTYTIDHAPVPAATGQRADHTADAINVYSVAVDDSDNIYVAGNFRTDLTIPDADGNDVVLHPKNVDGWDGDAQGTVGSFYLVKLDTDGCYLDHLAEEGGEIQASYIRHLKWNNGMLYFLGELKGKNDASVTIAGNEFTPTSYVCPLIGCLDSDLNARWIKCLPGGPVGGKNAVQNVGLSVDDNNVWLAGQYNGRISDPANAGKYVESTQGTMREGFIIDLDCNTGDWINAVDSRAAFNQNMLTGYLDVIVPASDPDNIYVYGYAMNGTVGVFLRSYDKTTLVGNPDKSWNIVTKGGVPTAQNIAYNPNAGAAYITVRGNQAFQPMGGELTANPGGYTSLLARFDLPAAFTTGVENVISAESDNLTFSPGKGLLTITNNGAATTTLNIYDVTGRIIATATVGAGESTEITLAPGLYIAAGRKFIL